MALISAFAPLSMQNTNWPWNALMVGLVNTSVDVASPLHTPRKLPSVIWKVNWLSASGHITPSLSTTVSVMKVRLSKVLADAVI